jgi:N-ethylmaleimide reductase
MTETILFKPMKLGDLELSNRIVMAPMTRGRAGEERIANELMAEYYRQRASAGLLITEATVVSPQGNGWIGSPGIYSDRDGDKDGGSLPKNSSPPEHRCFCNYGIAAGPLTVIFTAVNYRFQPLPSSSMAIRFTPLLGKKAYETPTTADQSTKSNKQCSIIKPQQQTPKQPDFSGIEVHAANGYLINQFLDSKTNLRTDEYGGKPGEQSTAFSKKCWKPYCRFGHQIGSASGSRQTACSMIWEVPDFGKPTSTSQKNLTDSISATSTLWMGLHSVFMNRGSP